MLSLNDNSQTKPLFLNVIRTNNDIKSRNISGLVPISKKTKYTLQYFLERAKIVHGDKYNYTMVTDEHITGVHSKIPVMCNTCMYIWNPTINNLINNKSGCPGCVNRVPYTHEIFLQKAKMIHGNKYNYDKILSQHIRGSKCLVPIVCNECLYEWTTMIDSHINNKSGCPRCAGTLSWTYEKFIDIACSIHGDKFNYNQVNSESLKTVNTKFVISCNTCNLECMTTINNHINNKNGCKGCAGLLPYTCESFIMKAKQIHQDKYDYRNITDSHIKGVKSHVPITCNSCLFEWTPTIDSHINMKSGCPNCAGNVPYNLILFMERARAVHGDKYNYTMVTEAHINGVNSNIPIICNICTYQWSPTIGNHINNKSGCPKCSNNEPWSYEKLIRCANEIHGDKYDYSLIKSTIQFNAYTDVLVVCKTCSKQWTPIIHNHINKRHGCPHCAVSRGYSLAQIEWIETIMKDQGISIQYALSPQGEYHLSGIGKVDGYCVENNTVYEFHGDYWHGNPDIFPLNNLFPSGKKGETFGDLYRRTLARDQLIRNNGYNLVVKWETDRLG